MDTKYMSNSGAALTDSDISEMYEDYAYWTKFDGEKKAVSFGQWLNTQLELGNIEEI